LGQVIGQCEALTPAPNVVERNRTKARSADCGFAEPSRRKAATVTVCYTPLCRTLFS